MLIYKAAQVIGVVKQEPKPWKMGDRSGVTFTAKMACVGAGMDTQCIVLKAKTAEELVAKVAKYTLGKPAEVPVLELVPVFKAGDRRASGYEMVA